LTGIQYLRSLRALLQKLNKKRSSVVVPTTGKGKKCKESKHIIDLAADSDVTTRLRTMLITVSIATLLMRRSISSSFWAVTSRAAARFVAPPPCARRTSMASATTSQTRSFVDGWWLLWVVHNAPGLRS
jgi:hypothetical protein